MVHNETLIKRIEILNVLYNHHAEMTLEEIGIAVNLKDSVLRNYLLDMLSQGLISRRGTKGAKLSGKKGNPYQYYILPNGINTLRFLGLI